MEDRGRDTSPGRAPDGVDRPVMLARLLGRLVGIANVPETEMWLARLFGRLMLLPMAEPGSGSLGAKPNDSLLADRGGSMDDCCV
jgi:hypothetical protein